VLTPFYLILVSSHLIPSHPSHLISSHTSSHFILSQLSLAHITRVPSGLRV
jgi:hypothetical protein